MASLQSSLVHVREGLGTKLVALLGRLTSFPGVPRLQFLITCSMQNWSWGRPGNEARDDPNTALLVPTPNEAR